MAAEPEGTGRADARSRWAGRLLSPGAAAVVLLLFYGTLLASLREKSPTFDEPGHATAGYTYWKFGDYRIDPENGNFSKRWIALPFLFGTPAFPSTDFFGWSKASTWLLADEWFNRSGHDPAALTARGRAMSGLIAVALGAAVNGYWSDTTNTMVVGDIEPTAKQIRYGVAAREAFHAAAEKLRPGNRAKDAFLAADATFEKYGLKIGHYAGHQIGVAVNEGPRLVPYDETPIQTSMVFSIETGAYEGEHGDTGARMEKSVIVHESGPEIICDFDWGF